MEALRVVTRAERLDGVFGHRSRRRHFGKRVAVRSPELQRPVGQARDLVALLVHRPMMPPTEQEEIRQRGGPALT